MHMNWNAVTYALSVVSLAAFAAFAVMPDGLVPVAAWAALFAGLALAILGFHFLARRA